MRKVPAFLHRIIRLNVGKVNAEPDVDVSIIGCVLFLWKESDYELNKTY